jgi:hypothetical protein
MLASYGWHTPETIFFYDEKSRNGKRYPFANVKKKIPFEGTNSIKTALEMEIICHFDFCYYRRNGFWSSNWVNFTKDKESLELKV